MDFESDEERTRAELRARQGLGARYDAEQAPKDRLLWARRGTAYLARKLNELSDDELDEPGLDGVSRRTVIARIAYQARALAQVIADIRTGTAGQAQAQTFDDELVDAETLPAHALRYLFAHSEIHLNVEWRDLPDAGWESPVKASPGWVVTPPDTVLLRARDVWCGALALGNGARLQDVPLDLMSALAVQAGQYWRAKGLASELCLDPEQGASLRPGHPGTALSLSRTNLARWLLGLTQGHAPELPPLPQYP